MKEVRTAFELVGVLKDAATYLDPRNPRLFWLYDHDGALLWRLGSGAWYLYKPGEDWQATPERVALWTTMKLEAA